MKRPTLKDLATFLYAYQQSLLSSSFCDHSNTIPSNNFRLPRFIDYFIFLKEGDMMPQKRIASCCNQILLDIRGGKEPKSRFVHSIIKNFNQHYQIERDTLQSIQNIQHSKLFLHSIVNPNSSSSPS